jgi:hypothetical protein
MRCWIRNSLPVLWHFPEPQPGLIISYAYLWHHEHRAGREEGLKDRPPRLFNTLMAKLAEVWTEGQGKATLRD